MTEPAWHDLGAADDLARQPLRQVVVGRTRIALACVDGEFTAISGACNHVGGPLGEGRLDGDYVVCPWHNWKYHRRTGEGEPGFEEERVPRYDVKVEDGRVWVNLQAATRRNVVPHEPHPLARPVVREPGPPRVAGISTTAMDAANPRFSTSDALLEAALAQAGRSGAETRLLRLRDLAFRHCEGYYSKAARACTWPCSITQMDPEDQLDRVYEALVHWADVVLVATPIRWGAASALYFKMAERLNCVQNQVTIRNRVLIRSKVAGFIVTGGQDNVQAVVGQMLTFFGELGFLFPQFPFIAHSRGWTAEDMENNVREVRESTELREGAEQLADRALALARDLLAAAPPAEAVARGGRKAHHLAPSATPAGEVSG
jgi:nitrite reductase/ring-hydroxylating ferredoxin subunit/multimeric flavodoxin WrbA